jgi:hypothetical protein
MLSCEWKKIMIRTNTCEWKKNYDKGKHILVVPLETTSPKFKERWTHFFLIIYLLNYDQMYQECTHATLKWINLQKYNIELLYEQI